MNHPIARIGRPLSILLTAAILAAGCQSTPTRQQTQTPTPVVETSSGTVFNAQDPDTLGDVDPTDLNGDPTRGPRGKIQMQEAPIAVPCCVQLRADGSCAHEMRPDCKAKP